MENRWNETLARLQQVVAQAKTSYELLSQEKLEQIGLYERLLHQRELQIQGIYHYQSVTFTLFAAVVLLLVVWIWYLLRLQYKMRLDAEKAHAKDTAIIEEKQKQIQELSVKNQVPAHILESQSVHGHQITAHHHAPNQHPVIYALPATFKG